MKRFEGTQDYVATDDLKVAVNAAVQLRRPLLVKGEPGTGKTVLAYEIAKAARRPPDRPGIRQVDHQGACRASTSTRRSTRLRDSQLGDRAGEGRLQLHSSRGKLWDAFDAPEPALSC